MANKVTNSKKKEKKIKKTRKKIKPPILRNEKDIAVDFASRVHKKFDKLIKATVLFGSQSKDSSNSSSDIDIIIIVDDASINWDLELVAWYREELAKLIAASTYTRELHVNTIKLTTWWFDLMHGDPVVINILRYGQALIDIAGFFNPIKSLLLQGKIHSTPEAVHAVLQRSPTHLVRSKGAVLGAIDGVYWTMVDAAQATLITLGKLPPSPEHITSMLKENFVDKNLLKKDYIEWYRDIHNIHKNITYGKINDIKGSEIDAWQDRAEEFLKKMTELINLILESSKNREH
jgi:uncharacterized protein (UPF0332 family)/predicted nucleotidyltransferase